MDEMINNDVIEETAEEPTVETYEDCKETDTGISAVGFGVACAAAGAAIYKGGSFLYKRFLKPKVTVLKDKIHEQRNPKEIVVQQNEDVKVTDENVNEAKK